MNRFLKSIFVIYFLIGVNSIAFSASAFKQHRGQGEVKISQGVFDILEFYLSGGKYGKLRNNPPEWAKSMLKSHWNPMFLIISKDGEQVHWYYDPHGDRADMNPNYLGKASVKCGKRGHGDCFVFAERRKIVWQNGINPKKGTLIKKNKFNKVCCHKY